MTATGHALVGTLIAGKIADPSLAFGISLLLHFPCDILPHWDSGTYHKKKGKQKVFQEAVVDVTISILASFFVFVFFLQKSDFGLLFLSVFASQLPDWISFPYFLWKIDLFPAKAMDNLQNKLHNSLDKPWGIVTQVATVVILYLVLYVVF